LDKVFYVQYHNFLSQGENLGLLEHTVRIQEAFTPATVVNASDDYTHWRNAMVVFRREFQEYYTIVRESVLNKQAEVCELLDIKHEEDCDLEVQLTAHNDGDFFKEHVDGGTDETNNRLVTFVYYFYKAPKSFTGGELMIQGSEQIRIEPINNMIVFFNPMSLHEVRKVHCPSKRFENSRFTLNGWILK
jgi:Rps23 Pro-64 3,4-dihydroxylase Tpa1-like proline 4-hydroxylase